VSDPVRIHVGSQNSAKLEAVRRGLAPFFPSFELQGCDVASGVSEQPIGFDEIITGARNRALRSFELGNCDLAAGIEDGLVSVSAVPTRYINLGCCVLYDGEQESFGFSSGFEYPQVCIEAATAFDRVPVGDSFERVFQGREAIDAGPWAGNIGRLTQGVLSRADYGAHAVICALIRLLHPDIYGTGR